MTLTDPLNSDLPECDLPAPALQAALKALHRLAQLDGDEVLGHLLEMTAAALQADRTSLWLLTPGRDAIRCRSLFERGRGLCVPDTTLSFSAAPEYFQAIDGLLVLAATDAQHDPRTRELLADYLAPLGIGAMLDVPVCEFGEIAGVLCIEHVGSPRLWTSAERLFVASLGGIFSQRHDRLRMSIAEDERRNLRLFDAATGLAGRALFIDRLADALAELPLGHDLVVLALDIERLRSLAHRYGGDFASSVMAEASARIAQWVPPIRSGRVADDTFALWVSGDRAPALATRLAQRLQQTLALPMLAPDGDSLEFSTAVGIVPGVRGERDADRLLREALSATFAAARKGRGRIEVAWPEVREALQSSLDLERDVRHAADARAFCFRLQPIVDLASGRLVGAEALMRWSHEGRDVAPSDFVPLLEENGLLAQVHMGLLRDLFGWASEVGLRRKHPDFRIHVNFSPVQLASVDLAAVLRDMARAHDVEGILVCEITENMLFSSGENADTTLRHFAAMGIPVELDDFGTGFASLSHLIDLPLYGLKIDRSFCLRCTEDPKALAVVAGLLDLARHLGLHVVAEGVETPEQRALLQTLGARTAQGYLFDRALDLDIFAARWLSEKGTLE